MTLATEKHPYRTLVIDSLSKLFNTTISNTAERMKAKGQKVEFGSEKKEAIQFCRRLVAWFERLDMNVVLICHEKDKWANGEVQGQTFDGWDKLEYELHLCLHVQKIGNARKARVTKSRLPAFADGSIFDWSFDNFAALYGPDIIGAPVVPVTLASADQIAEVTEYVTLLRADEWAEKALEKMQAETWAEVSSDNIAKCITALKAKLPKVTA